MEGREKKKEYQKEVKKKIIKYRFIYKLDKLVS